MANPYWRDRNTTRIDDGGFAVVGRIILCVLAVLWLGVPGFGQDNGEDGEPEGGWTGGVELGLVATSGNTETTTFRFKASGERKWEEGKLKLEAGALRVEETDRTLTALGTLDDFVVIEDETTEVTAESYHLRGRYDRHLTERMFAHGGAGWERDELAGIDNRFTLSGGLGNVWAEREGFESSTHYGVTYTREEPTLGAADEFLGLRLGWDLLWKLTETTTFTHDLVVDQNLDDTDDLRAEELAALAVAMTERLALKVSAQLKYDNQPAFAEVSLEQPLGTRTGEVVPVELDDLDTILSAALVVSF